MLQLLWLWLQWYGGTMPKTVKPKTQAQERAAIRDSEMRRMEHAMMVLDGLICKHEIDDQLKYSLNTIKLHLTFAIRNQHIKDREYAKYKQQTTVFADGDEF